MPPPRSSLFGLATASLLSVIVLLLTWNPFIVWAADKTDAILQAIQGLQLNVNDLRNQIVEIRNEVKNARTIAAKQTADQNSQSAALSQTVNDLDAGNQTQAIASNSARTAAIETFLKQQADQASADRIALMEWVRPTVVGLIVALFGMLAAAVTTWHHRKKMEDGLWELGAKVIKTSADMGELKENTNHIKDELIAAITAKGKLESEVQRAEGVIEGRESR